VPDDLPRDAEEDEPFTVSRRDWLHRVAGVSAGIGLAAAARHRKLVPFLSPTADVVPGVSQWYATSCRECPAGCGMIVRNREGRAVKCEGNPDHPINRGRLCARGQAALQGLYDPDRLRSPYRRLERPRMGARARRVHLQEVEPVTWEAALANLGETLARLRGSGRVAVISDLQTGSLAALIRRWLEPFGSDRYLVYEPLSYDGIREANRVLFGELVIPVPSLENADFILSFGADFLETWISPVQFTRQFAANRSARFVYVGPRVSLTAANAHERILVRPGDERLVALAMLQALHEGAWLRAAPRAAIPNLQEYSPHRIGPQIGVAPETLLRLARAFGDAASPVSLAGDPFASGPPAVESVLAANWLALSVGAPPLGAGSLHALSEAASQAEAAAFVECMAAGSLDVLLVIGADPAFSLPATFREAARAVKHVVSLTPFADDTTETAAWFLPTHTPLESWGDYEPQTGVLNTMQPVMGPLHDTRSAGDVLLSLAQAAGLDPRREFGAGAYREYLLSRWREGADEPPEVALQRGGRWGTPVPPSRAAQPRATRFGRPEGGDAPRLHVYPSAGLFDGRGSNRRWLQELPDPITKVAWSSWIEVHPDDAARLGVGPGDTVGLDGHYVAPVVLSDGLAPGTVAVPLGHGHMANRRYDYGLGPNPHNLRLPGPPDGPQTVQVANNNVRVTLPCADGSPYQHGRDIVRVVRASEVESLTQPDLRLPLPEGYTREGDMYPPHGHGDHRWAMAVDLNRCTGCGACVVACYAENNVGVVGPEQFAKHRMMAWIRIDRYFDWSDPTAPVLFLPLMCQHCDAAPCEAVCPVYAAAHSEEGVNMQVYNRCVGTRYCANNCPYKVRRFNWFDWEWPEPLNWQANPDVTVRSRGVMEKCTFCIQRIREAERRAKREKRALRDGEVQPACAQTCPAEALVFGDLMDPSTRIARIVAEDRRAYQLLDDLNTKPAVFYLKRIVDDPKAT
jgi:molybdopterin-containing oxidoreductase family iron-sulfur binding subunit